MKSLVVLKETHNIPKSFPALIPLLSWLLDLQQNSPLDVVVASQSVSWDPWQLIFVLGGWDKQVAFLQHSIRQDRSYCDQVAREGPAGGQLSHCPCRLSYYFRRTPSPLSSFGSTRLLFLFACFAVLKFLLVLKWARELRVLLIRNGDQIDCQVGWIGSQLRGMPLGRSMRTFPGSINRGDYLLEREWPVQGFQERAELVLPLKCIDNHCLITWLLLCKSIK